MDTPARTIPSNVFVTRDGFSISLKPWTAATLNAHARNFMTFVEGWTDLVTQDVGGVDAQRLQMAMPGLQDSLSNPADLERVHGLAELVRLVEAVWTYNEIGVGLGEALRLYSLFRQQIVEASPQPPTPL